VGVGTPWALGPTRVRHPKHWERGTPHWDLLVLGITRAPRPTSTLGTGTIVSGRYVPGRIGTGTHGRGARGPTGGTGIDHQHPEVLGTSKVLGTSTHWCWAAQKCWAPASTGAGHLKSAGHQHPPVVDTSKVLGTSTHQWWTPQKCWAPAPAGGGHLKSAGHQHPLVLDTPCVGAERWDHRHGALGPTGVDTWGRKHRDSLASLGCGGWTRDPRYLRMFSMQLRWRKRALTTGVPSGTSGALQRKATMERTLWKP